MNILFFIVALITHSIYSIQEVTDSGKLYPAQVTQILYPKNIQELQNIVIAAQKKCQKISIAGQRYSQGGQSSGTNTLNIDLIYFNKLLELNTAKKTVRVQAGMTWEELQNILQPHGLSIKVMQSSNVFSIAGSISVNAHGRDLRYGPIIETIHACTIIDSQGKIIYLSRQENAELFELVIGGYGLFGIIIEVELQVTDNVNLYKEQIVLPYTQYNKHFQTTILKNNNIHLYYGRLITTPGKHFLRKVISVNYKKDSNNTQVSRKPLLTEKSILFNQQLFSLYRKYYGKITNFLKTNVEQHIKSPWEKGTNTCRNQIMRPYIHCLKNKDPYTTDLLQEYFIPIQSFVTFTDQLRYWSEFYNIKLLNVTIRFVPKNNESFLSYSQQDCFAFVIYFTTKIDTKSLEIIKKYTHNLIESCHKYNGIFYLPYQQFATLEQIQKSYPMITNFITQKNIYDPHHIFINNWYENYIIQLIDHIK